MTTTPEQPTEPEPDPDPEPIDDGRPSFVNGLLRIPLNWRGRR
jgi:hypothetical protein